MSKVAKPSKTVARSPPSPPKKALSSYFLYRQEVYSDVRRDNPEAKMTEVTRIISEMWNALDAKEKGEYELAYQKNKAKYTREREAYEKKYGEVPARRKKSKPN
jgi:hypothetical protein